MNDTQKKDVQISKYQTGKKLIELVSRLKPGYPAQNMDANITLHHNWSKIGITLLDYSNGTGPKTISCRCNIDPDLIRYLLENLKNMMFLAITKPAAAQFSYSEEKLISKRRNEDGTSPMTKLKISRIPVGQDGQPRKQPWIVQIENGTAIPETTSTGGTMAQKGSYKVASVANITLTDKDMFSLLSDGDSYVRNWEVIAGANLIRYDVGKELKGENK